MAKLSKLIPLTVIMLIGPPGIGKSTLARNIVARLRRLRRRLRRLCKLRRLGSVYHEKDTHLAIVRAQHMIENPGTTVQELEGLYREHMTIVNPMYQDAIRESIFDPSIRYMILSSCNFSAGYRNTEMDFIHQVGSELRSHINVVYVTLGKTKYVDEPIEKLPESLQVIRSNLDHPFHFFVDRILRRERGSSSIDSETSDGVIINTLNWFVSKCNYELSSEEKERPNVLLGRELNQQEMVDKLFSFLRENNLLV